MAGHSKWANIKRRKGAVDAKRGKIFTKLVKEITTATRLGGPDPDANPRLRLAIVTAKSQSMPAANIDRAIKKGSGEGGGDEIVELTYEGYGPGGIALLVEAQTDNRNRTAAEIKASFNRNGGNLGAPGSVSWMFKSLGQFVFDGTKYTEEQLMDVALENGAEDIESGEGLIIISCATEDFLTLYDGFEKAGFSPDSAEVTKLADNTSELDDEMLDKCSKMIDVLEDLDDVQKVYSNIG